jgi:hypothetical protein
MRQCGFALGIQVKTVERKYHRAVVGHAESVKHTKNSELAPWSNTSGQGAFFYLKPCWQAQQVHLTTLPRVIRRDPLRGASLPQQSQVIILIPAKQFPGRVA